MSGKWTKRGIECEHEPSHLVADKDGVVVCNKRKPREEVPIGKLIIERLSPKGPYKRLYRGVGETLLTRLAPSSNKTPEVGLIACDPEIQQRVDELAEANAMVVNTEAYAKTKLEALSARFRDFIYEKGLAAPTIEALHDPKFGCPKHQKSRFFWNPDVPRDKSRPTYFYLNCLECSLNPELKERGTPLTAYLCEHCGVVLGRPETRHGTGDLKEHIYICKLCGTKVSESVSSR